MYNQKRKLALGLLSMPIYRKLTFGKGTAASFHILVKLTNQINNSFQSNLKINFNPSRPRPYLGLVPSWGFTKLVQALLMKIWICKFSVFLFNSSYQMLILYSTLKILNS